MVWGELEMWGRVVGWSEAVSLNGMGQRDGVVLGNMWGGVLGWSDTTNLGGAQGFGWESSQRWRDSGMRRGSKVCVCVCVGGGAGFQESGARQE